MGAEQLRHAAAVRGERIDLRQRRRGRRHLHRDPVRQRVEPPQRVGQRHRPAQDLGADPVGLELPLAGDRELDQHRADRREQHAARAARTDARRRRRRAAAEHQQVGQVPDARRRPRPRRWRSACRGS